MAEKKYFKITNAEENHHGFQYVNGLNILDKPFEEEGSCVKGGLYFSDTENILKFIEYGIYLREITFPDKDPDFKMVKDPHNDKWRANKIILGKRYKLSDVSTFEYLISLGVDFDRFMDEIMDYACENNNLDIVKFLIDRGADFRKEQDYPIQLASLEGHLEIVKFLFDKGSDIKSDENLAIRWASENGHLEVVKFLIKNGADCRAANDNSLTRASENGHLEVVKFLVEKGANVTDKPNNAIYWATENNHSEVVKFLLEHVKLLNESKIGNKKYFKITNAEENHHGFQYVDGLNVLDKPFDEFGSCVKGGLYFSDAENILKFIEYGIYLREITFPVSDPDFKMVKDPEGDKWRANKIILGRKYNLSDVSTFEYLISLGVNILDDFNCPRDNDVIEYACINGYLEVVKFLIEKGVDFRKKKDYPIQLAASGGHLEVVEFLFEKGADLKNENNLAIRLASRDGQLEVVKFLIKNGADCNDYVSSDTSVTYASKNGHLDVVKYLFKKGANLGFDNNLALRLASSNNHSEVVKFLIENTTEQKIE